MNFSMFLKLRKAIKKGKVEMPTDYKHRDFMINKEWLELELYDYKHSSLIGVFDPFPLLTGYALPTEKGEDKYYSVRNNWVKWILGTIISVSTTIALALLKMLLE